MTKLKSNLPRYVRFDDPHVFIAAAFYMLSQGIKIHSNIMSHLSGPEVFVKPVLSLGSERVTWQASNHFAYMEWPIARNMAEFIALVTEAPIMIGKNEVAFRKGSIQVGCTTVTNEKVREIASKLID